MTPEKYSEEDLHKVKNCLCFIRDCTDPDDSAKAERFLTEFIRRKENNIPVNAKQLEVECGIHN